MVLVGMLLCLCPPEHIKWLQSRRNGEGACFYFSGAPLLASCPVLLVFSRRGLRAHIARVMNAPLHPP